MSPYEIVFIAQRLVITLGMHISDDEDIKISQVTVVRRTEESGLAFKAKFAELNQKAICGVRGREGVVACHRKVRSEGCSCVGKAIERGHI